MAEYIEKQAALNTIFSEPPEAHYPSWYAERIKALPAADVAPVVHCKDCKHFNHKRMECENEAVSTDHEGGAEYSLNFELDDFCSYGERKDGGADND